MSDSISRQAAIDAAMRDVSCKRTHEFNAGAIRAANKIKQLPPTQRWIPVTERLPEDSQFVLMTIRRVGENYNHEPFISVGYISWNQSVWWCAHDGDCKSKDVRVDAWMPLPEPYKEDGEKNG